MSLVVPNPFRAIAERDDGAAERAWQGLETHCRLTFPISSVLGLVAR